MLIGTLFLIECVDCAAIKQGKQQPEVLRYEFKQLPYDGYYFLYELSDGQSRSEYGYFDDVNGVLTLNIVGSYSFIGTDDKKHTVKYTANENGKIFQLFILLLNM